MLLITCPVTRTDELVGDRRILAAQNHPTHVAVHVDCPACRGRHVYRTGRRWEAARAARTASTARQAAELVTT